MVIHALHAKQSSNFIFPLLSDFLIKSGISIFIGLIYLSYYSIEHCLEGYILSSKFVILILDVYIYKIKILFTP